MIVKATYTFSNPDTGESVIAHYEHHKVTIYWQASNDLQRFARARGIAPSRVEQSSVWSDVA